MTGTRGPPRLCALQEQPIGSVDPYALKIPARRAGMLIHCTTPPSLHSPPLTIRGVAPAGPPKWLPPPPPLTSQQ
jgi:hypothetical protein